MPHFIIEYSSNLNGRVNFDDLCDRVHETILATGLFEIGAVRVRAVGADAYTIADKLPENSFLDTSFRIGAGRSEDEKRIVGERLFATLSTCLKDLFLTPHFALSLEIREIDKNLSWKKNGIHPRLRKTFD